MTRFRWMMAAAIVGLSLVGNVSAQQLGGGLGGGTGGGGLGGGTGGGGGGGAGGGGATGAGGTTFNPSGGFSLGNAANANRATANSAIATSNILGPSFANPLFQGRAGSTTTTAPGGFGTPLYTTGNAPTGRAGGAGTGTTGTTGGTAGIGVTPSGGGIGGGAGGGIGGGGIGGGQQGQTTNRNSNNSVSQGIAIAATPRFPITPISGGEIETRVRAVLNRSTAVPNAAAVGIEMDGRTLVLSGQVTTDDERRLIENIIRLTPGVRQVRNDITLP